MCIILSNWGLYFDAWWLNLLCPRHACTHILNICVPPQQTEHSATTWSSMNCAHWRMIKAPARPSKTDSSSTSTTDTANCLNTEAAEETPTILRHWRSVRKLVWSQVSLTTADSPQKLFDNSDAKKFSLVHWIIWPCYVVFLTTTRLLKDLHCHIKT